MEVGPVDGPFLADVGFAPKKLRRVCEGKRDSVMWCDVL